MKHKSMPAMVANTDDTPAGVFEAIVSVFNNKDLGGDIVRPGAFVKSLEYWNASGDPIPIYWSHRMDDPTYNVGEILDAKELAAGDPSIPSWANDWVRNNGGLYVKGQIDDFGLGAQVQHLMKTRRVKQFSFSYDVLAEKSTKDGNELLDLMLYEVGPTPLGMNPLTELISAKSQPDPPPPETSTTDRRPSAVFLRHQAEIAAWQYELAD